MEEFYKDIEFILRASAPLAIGAIGYAAYRLGYRLGSYLEAKHANADEDETFVGIKTNLNDVHESLKNTAEVIRNTAQEIQRIRADLGDDGQDWGGLPFDPSGLDGWLGPEDFYRH